ncbi:glycosyltransferase family 4 protein [Salinarimonas soli]|uniref:glycosyltransferase family 4 protein n=1 Tax=Salinarimonas soli TaxID=1638099 RepID=UPI001F0A6962|nr:glycosyltransferase family 4 protein [Salinarimonas soli]
MRILHVLRAPVGGLFRHVVDLAREQAARGHQVGLFCDASTGGERAEAILAELAPALALGVVRVPMRRNPHPSDLVALLALRRAYLDLEPDVLHGHGSKGGAYARLVTAPSRDARTIRAYTPHGGSFNYQPGTPLHRLYMAAEGLLARRTDVFLFESNFIAGRFRAYVGETDRLVRVVLNGIGEAEFAPIQACPNQGDLVYVGELRAAKGVDTLIEAMGLLQRRGRRVTLHAIGSGPDEAALRAHAERVGVADNISFAGAMPIRHALGRGRVMVVPSRAESLPYVILEAAAAAEPLVSTGVGGIPEIFGPHAGALIPADDPEALAAAILAKLDECPEARAAAAAALSAFVRGRFSLGQMVEGAIAGYRAARERRAIPAARPGFGAPVKASVNAGG